MPNFITKQESSIKNYKNYIGGLIGYKTGETVANINLTGNITGRDYVGGLIGYVSSGTVTNTNTIGNINGRKYVEEERNWPVSVSRYREGYSRLR